MPRPLKSIDEVVNFLLDYSPQKISGETYTIDRMKQLMELLGNPQNKLKVIHVAGTSGKTSTAYFIRSLLEARGVRTGLTSSPHIVSVTERVQIGGKPLNDELFLEYLNEFLGVLDQWPHLEPSYFELLVAFAYWVFEKENVDYAVVEVGLGGTLDATNVAGRQDKVNIITPIGLDHTDVLGKTVEVIAAQKAGIIGPSQTVFSALQVAGASEVIENMVQQQGAELHELKDTPPIADLPHFQQENFNLAQSVANFVAEREGLPSLSHDATLACAQQSPPGRFEKFQIGGTTIILDGAHNPQKLAALTKSLEQFQIIDASWLISMVEGPDEKIDDCLEIIASQSLSHCIVTQFNTSQDIKGRKSVPLELLQKKAQQVGIAASTMADPVAGLDELLRKPATTIVVTGSLFLVSILRPEIIARSS